jgi:hypothetical protein
MVIIDFRNKVILKSFITFWKAIRTKKKHITTHHQHLSESGFELDEIFERPGLKGKDSRPE